MQSLINEIQSDINWRISEITTIKTLPTRYGMQQHHIDTLIWYSVPSIYALWEGYIKNTFQLYGDYLNRKNIAISNVDVNIITHAIDNECQLRDERVHFDKQKDFVKKLFKIFKNALNINTNELKQSNLNYKETNFILERFNLEPLSITFKKPLNKFLKFRNHIAHGENSIVVTKDNIEEFSFLIQDLMYDILLKIEESCVDEKFLFVTSP